MKKLIKKTTMDESVEKFAISACVCRCQCRSCTDIFDGRNQQDVNVGSRRASNRTSSVTPN